MRGVAGARQQHDIGSRMPEDGPRVVLRRTRRHGDDRDDRASVAQPGNLVRALAWSVGLITVLYLLLNLAFLRVLGHLAHAQRLVEGKRVAGAGLAGVSWSCAEATTG